MSRDFSIERTAEAIANLGWSSLSDFEVAALNANAKFYEEVRRSVERIRGREWTGRQMPRNSVAATAEQQAVVESFIRERWQWIANLERLYGENGSARIYQYRQEISFAETYGHSYAKNPKAFWDERFELERSQPAAEGLSQVDVLIQAVVVPARQTAEGHLIEAVALPWFSIVDLIRRDPNAMFEIGWRRWEEIIAGAYVQEGFEVVLTPRSNDRGRDVIATRRGFGSIRPQWKTAASRSPPRWS